MKQTSRNNPVPTITDITVMFDIVGSSSAPVGSMIDDEVPRLAATGGSKELIKIYNRKLHIYSHISMTTTKALA